MANHREDQSAEQQAFKVPEIKFTKLFINGEFLDSVSGKRFETRDPRNGEVAAIVAEGDKEDVDLAVKAARQAFKYGPWPRMSGYQRGRILMKFADLVEEHAVEIASLEALNAGKVVGMTAGFEIPLAVSIARYYGGAADKIHGETLKMGGEIPIQGYTLREPIGVVAHIIPWNFPTLLFLVKTTAALAAGCTMVVKPAEQTPLSALYLAHLAKLAGIPDGVINVVTGYGHTAGAALASHMDVDKISFTGSTEVGRLILQASAASNLKEVSLELGGKCPMIICDDADLDKAVDLAFTGSFINKGEMCIASSRVFVQESIHDQIVEKLVEKTKSWVVGDPFNPKVQQGPQVDKKQFEKIMSYIDHGKREGATLVTGGKRCGDNKGHYVEPTIFTDVKDDMLIARDEIFGPVVAVMKFRTIEEVIERANDTNYGLAAMLVTNNLNVANTVSRSLHAGMVWINCYLAIGADAPFGGFKMSGLGKDLGMDGLYKYTQLKTVVTPIYNSPWL